MATALARWSMLVGCLYGIVSLVTTWPLVLHFTTAIPRGTEREGTVPLFDLWALWWVADRAAHGFTNYWNAPIFYPNQGVTTYSEPLPFLGVLAAPLWWIDTPLPVIYNVVFLTILILNGVFAYRLARALTIPPFPAMLSGVLSITLPIVTKFFGVLPNMALFGVLWTLEGLVRFGAHGTIKWAIWAVIGFLATYLTMQQYALFFAPFAAAAAIVALEHQRFRIGAIVRLSSVGFGISVLLLWFVLPVLQVHATLGFFRPAELVQALSARPQDFVTRPETAWLSIPPTAQTDTGGLFPGTLLCLLAGVGGVASIRGDQRRWGVYLMVSIIVAHLLALGLNLNIFGWRPFVTLRATIPGFADVRSPYRFVIIAQACLPILATYALAHMQRPILSWRVMLPVFVSMFAVIENLAAPTPLMALPAHPRTAWTAWLHEQPNTIVVAHIPFPNGLHVADYEVETWRMVAQMDHHQPMINGYSSYLPQVRTPDGQILLNYAAFQLEMAGTFPTSALLCVLHNQLNVTLVIVDKPWLHEHQRQMLEYQAFLDSAYTDDQVEIYTLRLPADACSAQ